MRRYSIKTDFLSIRVPLIAFVCYLFAIILFDSPFITSSSFENGIAHTSNDMYFWYQFVAFIFVCTIVSFYFEQTFTSQGTHYLSTVKLGVNKVVFYRYLRLLIILEALYLPFIVIGVIKSNKNIAFNAEFFNTAYKLIDISKTLFQYAVAMLFYVSVLLFLMMIFKNRIYVMVLCLGYCSLEATALPVILGDYALFRGAFNSPDFHHYFTPNITYMFISSLILLPVVLVYSKKKLRF